MNENERACAKCGAVHPVDEMTEISGDRYVCADCVDECVTCEQCGELFLDDEIVETSDGSFYCADCVTEAGYCFFEHCEEWVPEDETYSVHTRHGWTHGYETWCEDCIESYAFYCEGCNEYYDESSYDSYEGPGCSTLCSSCYENETVTCGNCDEVIWRDNAHWDDDADMYLCEDCYEQMERVPNVIHDYGYKPRPAFHDRGHVWGEVPVDVKALFFGVEDEADKGENPRAAAKDVQDVTDALYIKHDGSLENGFEIVTHPCTLAYHMYEFPWRHVCSNALKHGFKSHDARTCGLHVHVGCGQFADSTDGQRDVVAKIVLLVDRHWDALVTFSRRKAGQLDHWASRPRLDNTLTNEYMIRRNALSTMDEGRYQAINLTNFNRNRTIEFRLFNGSLKRDTIIATLQLVSNLCKYAMAHTMAEVLASSFMDIVRTEEFKELSAYVDERFTDGYTVPEARVIAEARVGDTEGYLEIGARVRCINNDGEGVYPNAIGLTGVVVGRRDDFDPSDEWTYEYVVVFDCGPNGAGHNVSVNGEIHRNGYYFHRQNLERIS